MQCEEPGLWLDGICYNRDRFKIPQNSEFGLISEEIQAKIYTKSGGDTYPNLMAACYEYDQNCQLCDFNDVSKCRVCVNGANLLKFASGEQRCHVGQAPGFGLITGQTPNQSFLTSCKVKDCSECYLDHTICSACFKGYSMVGGKCLKNMRTAFYEIDQNLDFSSATGFKFFIRFVDLETKQPLILSFVPSDLVKVTTQ